MSLLASELRQLEVPYSGAQAVISNRLVDTATRLHAWSIPIPLCVHGLPLDRRCDGCNDVAPLSPRSNRS
jgi:hypothetical protein